MQLQLSSISAKGGAKTLNYLTYFYTILASTRGPLYRVKLVQLPAGNSPQNSRACPVCSSCIVTVKNIFGASIFE